MGCFSGVLGEFFLVEPVAAAAVWVDELGGGLLGGVDVIEEAAVDEVLGVDFFVAVFFWEVVLEFLGEDELVLAEAGEFAGVVVAGVWAGEVPAFWSFYCEVEFYGELEVDEFLGGADEEIEFAEGVVDVGADLEVFFGELGGAGGS